KLTVVVAIAALVLSAGSALAWTGSLSTTSGGLIYGGGWEPATLTWDVTMVSANVYRYDYTLDIETTGGISHMILELTDDAFYNDFQLGSIDMFNLQLFDGADWVNWSPVVDVKEHEKGDEDNAGGGNPGMPTDLFGIKYDDLGGDETYLRWRFDAYRMPVWGDFYAKDGGDKVLYNAGFALADPLDGPADGSIDNHILRPNGRTPELPPSALMSLGMLPLGIAYIRGRRRKED
ncbi:MAG: hypothetical protein R6V07_13110, partial [Armatimonadota bacterium]